MNPVIIYSIGVAIIVIYMLWIAARDLRSTLKDMRNIRKVRSEMDAWGAVQDQVSAAIKEQNELSGKSD